DVTKAQQDTSPYFPHASPHHQAHSAPAHAEDAAPPYPDAACAPPQSRHRNLHHHGQRSFSLSIALGFVFAPRPTEYTIPLNTKSLKSRLDCRFTKSRKNSVPLRSFNVRRHDKPAPAPSSFTSVKLYVST